MDSDSILTFGLIGIGGYAIYKLFSDSGVGKTTSAIGDVAQSAGGLITTVTDAGTGLFKATETATQQAVIQGQQQYKEEGFLAFNPIYQANKAIISTITSFIPKPIATTPQAPIYTNIGMTQTGAYYSSANPQVATISTSQGAVAAPSKIFKSTSSKSTSSTPTQSYTGARVGTIFSSGASVKSVGKSGKY